MTAPSLTPVATNGRFRVRSAVQGEAVKEVGNVPSAAEEDSSAVPDGLSRDFRQDRWTLLTPDPSPWDHPVAGHELDRSVPGAVFFDNYRRERCGSLTIEEGRRPPSPRTPPSVHMKGTRSPGKRCALSSVVEERPPRLRGEAGPDGACPPHFPSCPRARKNDIPFPQRGAEPGAALLLPGGIKPRSGGSRPRPCLGGCD